jgi:menaquinone-specific isochorismate synthase
MQALYAARLPGQGGQSRRPAWYTAGRYTGKEIAAAVDAARNPRLHHHPQTARSKISPNQSPLMQTEALLRELDRRLRELLAGPRRPAPAGYLTVTLAIPPVAVQSGIAACTDCIYWARPAAGHYRLGSGRIGITEAAGPQRFRQLESGLQALNRDSQILDPDATGGDRPVFTGFAFSPTADDAARRAGLPNSLLFVPEVLLERRAETARLVLTCRAGPALDVRPAIENWLFRTRLLLASAADAPVAPAKPLRAIPIPDLRHDWPARVRGALAAIAAGTIDKVVLSRCLRLAMPDSFQLQRMLDWLEARYRECTLFALRQGGQTLVGVSPEQLVALEGGRVRADAIGGTTARSTDPVADRRLGAALLQDAKSRNEHRLVVDAIAARLASCCSHLVIPDRPSLKRLPTVQHLYTPVTGQARAGLSLLGLAAILHPTPAVGGLPQAAALAWMERNGEHQRGWYTGALGWLGNGGGELSVILRCALLGQQRAELHAGAGIVAGSDPQQELMETEWKLQAMVEALQAGAAGAPGRSLRRPDAG